MNSSQLIKRVRALSLPLWEYAVFGSGPLVVRGIRESNDIDLIVLPELYESLKARGFKEERLNHGTKLTYGIFEVYEDWITGDYNPDVSRLISNSEIIGGIPFVKLEEVLRWKSSMAIEKDELDINLIREYLRNKTQNGTEL